MAERQQNEHQERKVPVLRTDNSLIDLEFDSVRERFEAEMRKMEEEMARFRAKLIESERQSKVSSSRLTTTTTSSTTSSSSKRSISTSKRTTTSAMDEGHSDNQQSEVSGAGLRHEPDKRVHETSDWLSSPLIKEQAGNRLLELRFDVSAYAPDEIFVKTIDNRLQVHAERKQTSENTSIYSEYNREFLLPEGTEPELIRSSLSADGVLVVEAPLPALNPKRAA